ncbi:MAG: hypothetical protein N3F64_01335 [Nitrososphaeria archaeon]|nr:hypothetical protein [Nitrososphaeria archaeon]
MVKRGIFVRIDKELYDRAKHISFDRDISLGELMEDALRTYFASLPATYTNIKFLQKHTKDKVDYLIQYFKDLEKAQPQYIRSEIEQLIRNLLQVEDERTVKKYFKILVTLKVLEFHQYNPVIIINKVYPLQQSAELKEESESKAENG